MKSRRHALGLYLLPGLPRGDVSVDPRHERAYGRGRVMQAVAIERRRPRGDGVDRGGANLVVVASFGGRLPAEGVACHLHGARQRVAEPVREVGVVTGEEILVGEIRVPPERHGRDEVPAQRVHAEGGDEVVGPNDVARGLGHLPGIPEPPSMRDDLARDWKAGRHEERRPVDRVEAENVLADDVDAGPVTLVERKVAGAEPERGDVVRERVEPHVDDVPRAPREWDAPRDRRARHGEILQARLHERAHFVQARLGKDERLSLHAPLEELEESGSVLRQAEEDVLLALPLGLEAVDRAVPQGEILLRIERLAVRAVPALVPRRVEVARRVDAPDNLLDARPVARLGRADEVVVRDAELFPEVPECRRMAVRDDDRSDAFLFRDPLDVLPVLVRAGQEAHVLPLLAEVTRERVRDDRRVEVPDVRPVVDVIDGGREVAGRHERTRITRGGLAPGATAPLPGRRPQSRCFANDSRLALLPNGLALSERFIRFEFGPAPRADVSERGSPGLPGPRGGTAAGEPAPANHRGIKGSPRRTEPAGFEISFK